MSYEEALPLMYPVKFIFANQLSLKIQSELNAAFNDIAPDLFLRVYGQSERKMELK